VADDLAPAGAVDLTVAAGTQTLNACTANSTTVAGDGTCTLPATNIGAKNQSLVIDANANYTLLIQDGGPTPATLFPANDLSQTGLGEFNYTLHTSAFVVQSFDVCIGGVKVITGLAAGGTQQVSVTAQQAAPYAIFPSASGCATPQANVNFAAGTNFVQTLAATSDPTCGAGCVQVLLVGQGTVPNNPDTVAFCNNILTGLTGVQPALKTLVGNVDPTSTQTIKDTQPSVGDMKAFVSNTQAILDAGDASVPAAIADAWATSTAGLRTLLTTFQLAGYDLSTLPVSAVEAIVEGANGITLPGVPPDQDVVAATDALTAFVTGTCLATTPSTTPTAATPVAATAHFTG
jgi:hypothetical protein